MYRLVIRMTCTAVRTLVGPDYLRQLQVSSTVVRTAVSTRLRTGVLVGTDFLSKTLNC
jgi:hypothetical protein